MRLIASAFASLAIIHSILAQASADSPVATAPADAPAAVGPATQPAPDIDEPFKPTWNELKRLTDNPRGRDKMIGLVKDLNIDLSVVPHEL
ncbi:MAG TPA: hypothetical protein PLS23_18185, partial [Phycisphaerae bacterium]|nr:hypothetical protein [Phycisphaerae bacterium]